MDDYIKRKDLHIALDNYYFTGELSLKETIDNVPSANVVEQETKCACVPSAWTDDEPPTYVRLKKGKWDKDSDMAFYWKCSECGAYLFWRHEEFMVNGNPNYCPNCGAQMERSEE